MNCKLGKIVNALVRDFSERTGKGLFTREGDKEQVQEALSMRQLTTFLCGKQVLALLQHV
jgi:hypothetical protein